MVDKAAGSGSVVGIGSNTMSIVGISWVSRSAVGSGSLSTVGLGSGAGVVRDVKWDWTLGTKSSSTLSTVKEHPFTHKAKLIYYPRVQQESPFGITIQISSSSPLLNLSISVRLSQVV